MKHIIVWLGEICLDECKEKQITYEIAAPNSLIAVTH